jgi:amino acid adenylation domain-containing protein
MKLLPSEKNWKTLNELLESRAAAFSEKTIYNLLTNGVTVSGSQTYGELDLKAKAIAAHLQDTFRPGDRVLLLFPQDLDYIAAFFGCLYAGMIAVPAYPPRNNRNFGRLETLIYDSGAAGALLSSVIENRIKRMMSDSPLLSRLRLVNTDSITATGDDYRTVAVTEDSIAFLQYTSGSTSDPKGVIVTHGNLIQNQEMIRRLFRQSSESVILGWLPLYHDMGLIGNVLQPLYVNAECYLMTPAEFIQNPLLWLKAISTFRATTSGGPNFAYEHCLKRIKEDEISVLDLSCWLVAFNGAEPVRAATLEDFARFFKPAGFDKKAFVPCYGLAEATLLVSAGSGQEEFAKAFDAAALEQNRAVQATGEAKLLVDCGQIAEGIELEIVNPSTAERAGKDEIGEIWISAPSVAKGYWKRPEETEKTFRAEIKSQPGRLYLRTGDLGFRDAKRLIVTGRIKDLIILNGRNLYPQDIEKSVERTHPALRKEGGAAFSKESGSRESLVIVHEIEPRAAFDAAQIFAGIQKVLATEYEISADEIILIRAGALPKTSSGKKQRSACRADFLNNKLEIVERYAGSEIPSAELPANEFPNTPAAENFDDFKRQLKALTARTLKIAPARLDDKASLLNFGLDSLTALELTHALKQFFKVDLPVATLLETADFESICKIVRELKTGGVEKERTFDSPGKIKPLSAGQKSLWFLQQLAPDNTAYNLNFLSAVKSTDFDRAAFRMAFEKVSMRHDNLRSTFFVSDGVPRRKIHDSPLFEWRENVFPKATKKEIKELVKLEFQKPFDLVNGPLLRIGLWEIENGETLFSFSVHHIVADFWSLAILFRQLSDFYRAGDARQASRIEVSGDYEQFVSAERNYIDSEAGQKSAKFWREQLAGDLPVLELPFDNPRGAVQSFRGETVRFKLGGKLVEELKKLSTDQQSTLFVTLLAAYKVLLYRYTNQTDCVVGTPTAGRENPAYRNMVGYFVNPVAVRSFPASRLSFTEYLARVKKTFLEVLRHRDFPFLQVVENSVKSADPARSPIFQTMFILQQSPVRDLPDLAAWAQNGAGGRLDLNGLPLESEEIEQSFAQFDLSLMLAEYEGELSGALQYNSDLFKRSTIERIAKNFKELLSAIVRDPHKSIAELDVLADEEYEEVVFGWNRTDRLYDQNAQIHDFFEKQAALVPHDIALSVGKTRLTYRELNERANRFANYLRKRGVQLEDRIGVCLERRENLIVVLLGILKSGAAYVPLDAAYPKQRLRLMLEDSRAKFVITENSLSASVPMTGSEIVNIDTVHEEIEASGRGNPNIAADARNLAYIIYTSGSTGRPKGVAIEHRSVCALIEWAGTVYSAAETKKVLASTSICFDLSVFEIFFTLSRGGEIRLAENALALINSTEFEDVTLINTVPSAMAELCRHKKISEIARTVNLAGERLLGQLIEKVYANPQVERLYNLYGPSEDTTYSTFALMPDDKSINSLIGKPINNSQVYLLNERLQPVPIGAIGEIYIGGDGLTRGYFDKPGQTAEKFIPDSLSGKGGARLYKTNDLARFTENGNLIFLGRDDHQVKIRGFRIELGEIETVLGRHPMVKETVVVAHTSEKTGEKSIAAYVVANGSSEPSKETIKLYLAERLPSYMIPRCFVFLEALPLTPNGKIDRRSLPAPLEDELDRRENVVPPRNPVEDLVLSELAEILGGKNIDIFSNFFENGGHSLSAAQAAYRLREIFQVEIPLRTIFEKPNAAELAEFIAKAIESGTVAAPAPIKKIGAGKPLRLSSAQKKLWFIEKIRPLSAAYNISAAVCLKGSLDVGALQKAFEIIINRHDSFRTRFIEIDGEPFQIVDYFERFNLEIEDRINAKDEINTEIKAEARRGFDLSEGRLIRVRLWQVAADEYVLMIVMHHIITDGWSLGILVKEINREYAKQVRGEEPEFEENKENENLQYGDYAEWQTNRLENGELAPQIEFWKKKLAGITGKIDLPADYERPAEPSFKGGKIPVRIDSQTFSELKKIERREGVTLFMILLAAFNILLRRYTGETDICIGVPVANRFHRETENIIGFFVNSLVIRTRLDKNETVRSLLQKTRNNAIEAFSQQELPFDILVENLPISREISRNPIFQVAFALQNTSAEPLSLPGIKSLYMEVDTETAKFDLTLDLRETESGLEGYLEYDASIFSEATTSRIAKHFVAVTALLSENLSCPVEKIPFLSPAEICELTSLANAERADFPADSLLPEIFSKAAKNNPAATALIWESGQLTFRELEEQSNRLANHLLLHAKINPGDFVGIGIARAPEAVISMLGILKAGGVYVPLEPSLPPARINYILGDTKTKLILSLDSENENFENSHGAKIEAVRAILEDERLPKNAPAVKNFPSAAAYVMYTSGSTGQPKGVSVTHRNVVRLVKNQNYANLDASEVILQLAPLSFDASTFEIWGALLNGARLVLMPEGSVDAGAIGRALRRYEITTLWLTAGLFHLMVDEEIEALMNLRQLLAGGDILSAAHVNKFLEMSGGKCALVNGYGPTENTTFTACFPMRAPWRGRTVPIGRSITNTQVYIVDDNLELVPRGVVGELVTGGDGVADGYLNKPRQTAEFFVPDPFIGQRGARLYRTGDLARMLGDGTIEFVGRKDEQVKISGYRIEPAEIETVLRLYPAVTQAVVITEKNDFGEKTLAAFIKTGTGDEPDYNEIKAFLRKNLPAYMIPPKISAIAEFPLTSNGKVDKKALAQLATPRASDNFQAPRTQFELDLVEIWKKLLGKSEIGIDDDFFNLGGHSLLATRLAAAIGREFSVEISIVKIFENPTVRQQAEIIYEQKKYRVVTVINKPIAAVRRGKKNIESLLNEVEEIAHSAKDPA